MKETWTQKIGTSKGAPRLCLWNKKLIPAGFDFGQPIKIDVQSNHVAITPVKEARRKVSKVMNHGNELPVIDIKQTRAIDLASLFVIGDPVRVTISAGRIILEKSAVVAALVNLAA